MIPWGMESRRERAAEVDVAGLDLGHLALFVGLAFAEEAQRALASHGLEGLRFSHGFVFQHLIDGERTVTELAARMEVTQQAASKVVAELLELGVVERVADEADARVRRIRLTRRGRAAVARTRDARAALMRKLEARHGKPAIDEARALLGAVLDDLGGAPAVRARRVLLPR